MKKSRIAIAAFLATVGISSVPIAAQIGPATVSAIQPAQAPGGTTAGCAFFEVTGGAVNAWYAMVVTDASFNSQFGIVMSSFYSGTPIVFTTAGTACGYTKVQAIAVGTVK